MFRKIFFIACCVLLSACGTQMKVVELDSATGQLKSSSRVMDNAVVLVSKKTSFNRFAGRVFTSGAGEYHIYGSHELMPGGSRFGVDQLKALNLFSEVWSYEDLQRLVAAQGLQEKVPSVDNPIGLSRLAKFHGPFLWVRFNTLQRDSKFYVRLSVIDTENFEELFLAEINPSGGINDQNSSYPLFNSLIRWVRMNQ